MKNYEKYKIYDAHAHIFPEKIAAKATVSIGEFYGYKMTGAGTGSGLEKIHNEKNVAGFLVSSTATAPKQVLAINDFIKAECDAHPYFVGFGSMHPAFENPEAEIERMKAMGLKGVKFHPDFQTFNIDDPKMDNVYKKIAELDMFVLFHMGDERYDYSHPVRLGRLTEKVPSLKAIAAHFGGHKVWSEIGSSLDGKNVVFDTSSSLYFMDKEEPMRLLEHFGYEKFMFGTDHPMWELEDELERFLALPLKEEQRTAILSENFERIFNIKG